MTFRKRVLAAGLVCACWAPTGAQSAVTKYVDGSAAGCANGSTNYNPASRSCGGGGSATVYTTIHSGLSNMGASNILVVRAGTYLSQCAVLIPASGSLSAYTTITKLPGEAVVWKKDVNADNRSCLWNPASRSFIKLAGNSPTDKFIMDGSYDNSSQALDPNNYEGLFHSNAGGVNFTFEYVEIRNSWRACWTANGASPTNYVFRHVEIHHCNDTDATTNQHHGIYADGPLLVEHSSFHHIGGYAVHAYHNGTTLNSNNATVRYSKFWDFGMHPGGAECALINDGSGSQFYGNQIIGRGTGEDCGIQAWDSASGLKIYHNSITNVAVGVSLAYQGSIRAANTDIRNNIIWGVATNISDTGTGTIKSPNFCASGCAANGNPLFTNIAAHDLSLQAGSPAINNPSTDVIAGFNYIGEPDFGAVESAAQANALPAKVRGLRWR